MSSCTAAHSSTADIMICMAYMAQFGSDASKGLSSLEPCRHILDKGLAACLEIPLNFTNAVSNVSSCTFRSRQPDIPDMPDSLASKLAVHMSKNFSNFSARMVRPFLEASRIIGNPMEFERPADD